MNFLNRIACRFTHHVYKRTTHHRVCVRCGFKVPVKHRVKQEGLK